LPCTAAADVALRFEDGILLGLLEASTGFVLINPPPGYALNADEHLILLRPTSVQEVRCELQQQYKGQQQERQQQQQQGQRGCR
jgi:hypothetical protein